MSDHHDWVLVASACDAADARLERFRAEMDSRLAEVKEEWSSNAARAEAALEAQVRKRQEDHVAWLRARADEVAPKNVAAGGHEDGTSVLTDASAGHNGLQQRPNLDPRAAELADRQRAQEMAAAVHDMDPGEYAQLRAELHIGSASARGLFDS